MILYLRAKFEVPSIILPSFRQGVILLPTSKRTPKKPAQIRVKHQNRSVKFLEQPFFKFFKTKNLL